MMNVRKIGDGTFARKYLRDCLSHEWSTLTSLAYKKYSFANGAFFIIAPDSADVDQLTAFGSEIRDVDHSDAVRLFASIVKRFIDNRNCTVLLRDFRSRPSDPDWEEYEFKDRAAIYNDEVYWEARGPDTSQDEVERLVSDWCSYFPVRAFFCVSQSSERKNCLAEIDFENLADNLVGVAVDTFDGDSLLIWWRDDLQPLL